MSDDQPDCGREKGEPTTGKRLLDWLTPDLVRQRLDVQRRTNDSQDGIDRRSFMLRSGGAATAAVGGTVGTAALQSPATAVQQPEAYGYGGANMMEARETTLSTSSLTTQTVTQTEANDERSSAMAISPGTTVEATLDAATVDWFAFDAQQGDPITVEYDRDPAVGVTGLVVYSPDGSFKERLFVGTDSVHQLATTAETAGTHYLQVLDVERGDGPYTVTVYTTENPDDGSSDGGSDDGSSDDDSAGTGQTPYGGTMRTVPGRIQAEEFDEDGQEVAYLDTTQDNRGGEFRPNEYVDIEQSNDATNEYSVGYAEAGEWLEYSVDVTAGTYALGARVSTTLDNRQVAVSLGGERITTVDIPNTGGWYAWDTVTVDGIEVTADGPQILRVEFLDRGINLNWIEFTEDEQDDDYGTQTYGDMTYGGLSN